MPTRDNSGKYQHADRLSQGCARNLEIVGKIGFIWQTFTIAPLPSKDRKPHFLRDLYRKRLSV